MTTPVFSAVDVLLFYVFFEATLIPMYIIVGVWGGPNRIYAAFKFFLYTLLGSVLMLLAIMAMYWQAGTTDIAVLSSGRVIQARSLNADLAVSRVGQASLTAKTADTTHFQWRQPINIYDQQTFLYWKQN